MQISEIFYSVQAEGVSNGVPSVFIRLAGCNLRCGLPTVDNIKNHTQEELEKNKHPSASWVCDSMAVWSKGERWEYDQVIQWLKNENLLWAVASGKVHIIFTGGEPTLKKHVKDIITLMDTLEEYVTKQLKKTWDPYTELETNGTLNVPPVFYQKYISQINCSPKLSNSGHTREERFVVEALEQIREHPNHWFKFVVSNIKDILEIQDFMDILETENVVLMPALVERDQYHYKQEWIYEMAKQFKLRAVNRNHISAWDKKTGV
nr:radical SAM protein [bacterium]